MSDIAIRAEGLSKRYKVGKQEKYRTLRDTLAQCVTNPFKRKPNGNSQGEDSIWAIKDLSFEIKHGDVVGIIGRNGAGKSTLLKVLSRITDPTKGRAEIFGRVGSLLEVGTGFHPELTGRENIFLNGAILGMRRVEILSKFDEIVAFSEIEKFLDTPVKHYSTGMYVRLAFAIAAHLEPEILIVDEVLAVGDLAFQKKCIGKMNDVSRAGRTVLFVSHNMAAIENLCRHGIVLAGGKLVFDGTIKDASAYYFNSLAPACNPDGHVFDLSNARDRISRVGKLLKKVELYTEGNQPVNEGVRIGDRLKVRIHFDLPSPTTRFNIGLGFNNAFGQRIFTAHSLFEAERSDEEQVGAQIFVCDIPSFTLTQGTYTARLWLDIANTEADLIEDAVRVDVIESDFYGTGKVPWNGSFVLQHRWYLEPEDSAVHQRQLVGAVPGELYGSDL
jgi:lipopolysaccharide transport system ATP-binding protein